MSIKFNCEVKVKHNFKNIEKIVQKLPKIIEESVEDILKNIQGYAIKLEKGHNQDGILFELVDTTNMKVKGKVYADPSKFMADKEQSYLWFEYFGTGAFAELGHIGNTEHFKQSGFTEWLIPVKPDLKLNYKIITIKGIQFYLAHRSKTEITF